MTSQTKCCEKCLYEKANGIQYCQFPSCPCHQVATNGKKSRAELIEKIVGEFETEFLNKWFPPEVDALMLDMDSRGMRERGRDFLRSALLKISDASMDAVEVEEADSGWTARDKGYDAARTASQEKRTLFVK